MEKATNEELIGKMEGNGGSCGGGSGSIEMEKATNEELIGKMEGNGGSCGGSSGGGGPEMEKAMNVELIGKKEGNGGSGGGGTSCGGCSGGGGTSCGGCSDRGGTSCGGRGGGQICQPPPPFLTKTYNMVDDPNTNELISWSATRKSIVIWDHIKFAKELLPKHFRHNNFSSFIYQLNKYGFKKIGFTRYEYENPWFQADNKHLLNNIKGRAAKLLHNNDNVQRKRATSSSTCQDFAANGSDEAEIKKLKKDYNTMEMKLSELKQRQDTIEGRMAAMEECIENANVSGKQGVFMFVEKAITNPLFVKHFIKRVVHQSPEGSMKLVDLNEKNVEELETTNAEGTSDEKSLMAAKKLLLEEDLVCENGTDQVQIGPVQSRIVMELEDLIAKPQDKAWAEFAKELMEKSGLPNLP
ncbi:hypothetical protein Vadar_019680 [Vaccinium darrowii]|uniref:Uncharacterized protein n=1 Tax=Vaccinium darrowii TaxID=229202 RepID=A0ACB7YX62_9ERIC|nr:hypothetical protein Vadar_019680 [Vaccinium darrowii]